MLFPLSSVLCFYQKLFAEDVILNTLVVEQLGRNRPLDCMGDHIITRFRCLSGELVTFEVFNSFERRDLAAGMMIDPQWGGRVLDCYYQTVLRTGGVERKRIQLDKYNDRFAYCERGLLSMISKLFNVEFNKIEYVSDVHVFNAQYNDYSLDYSLSY